MVKILIILNVFVKLSMNTTLELVSINRFLTPSMKRSDNPNILYQLVLASDADEGQLRQIKTIDNFRIKFEKMNQSKTIQCRRCQRFTHAASSCGFKYRCVQCTQTHGPGCCPRINNKKLPMGCINCLNANLPHTNHTANDLVNCGFFKKIRSSSSNTQRQGNGIKFKTVSDAVNNNNVPVANNVMTNRVSNSNQNRNSDDLEEIIAPANGPNSTNKKTKRMINQYRPGAKVSGNRNQSGKSNSVSHSSGAGGSGPLNKNELFKSIAQLLGQLQKMIR